MGKRYRQVGWKRNIKRIPASIRGRLTAIEGDVTVAVVKKIPLAAIEAGQYAHVGLIPGESLSVTPKKVLPDPRQGRYSKLNRFGWVVVFRNRPKIWRSYSWETPNWGDPSKGYHTVDMDRRVYQRELHGPPLLEVHAEIMGQEEGKDGLLIVVRFAVDEVLSPGESGFHARLFFDLNLLQENVGVCDVFPSTATRHDYLQSVYVHWEILPPGSRETQVNTILGSNSRLTPRERKAFEERFDFLMSLKPVRTILGTSGFRRYFGAQFANDLVVFENVEYGNALYVMFSEWEELSRRSRTELLSAPSDGFVRIVHSRRWKTQLLRVFDDRIRRAA